MDYYTLLSQPEAPRHNGVNRDKWPDGLGPFPNRKRAHLFQHYYQASLDSLVMAILLVLHSPQVSWTCQLQSSFINLILFFHVKLTFSDSNVIDETIEVVVFVSDKLQNWYPLICLFFIMYIMGTNNSIDMIIAYLVTMGSCDQPSFRQNWPATKVVPCFL